MGLISRVSSRTYRLDFCNLKMPDIKTETDIKSWDNAWEYLEKHGMSTNPTPIIFKSIDIGTCTEKWTSSEYLKSKISDDHTVQIHLSEDSPKLNFTTKNFTYKSLTFHEFLETIVDSENADKTCYLRSTSQNFRKDAARIRKDFPELRPDIKFCDACQTFSTILRVSSPNTQVWMHYDTVQNFLMQVVGFKKVLLMPPSAASSVKLPVDSDKPKYADPWKVKDKFDESDVFEAMLEPGDVLFLPSHWFHATKVIPCPEDNNSTQRLDNSDCSISVNHFWKDPAELKQVKYSPDSKNTIAFHDKKDLYGNKAPRVAQEAERLSKQINFLLEQIPNDDVRAFYQQKCSSVVFNTKYVHD